ncbi:hypothetical protein AB5R26_003336 [Enterobacter mori]|uniref:hypothetical protein n=1 Tax=Enterobacter pseudoroggenkampii TaxID=2996112 RepID=UPI0017471B76
MSNIKELSFYEIALVSGGEGHGTEVNRDRREAQLRGGIGYGAQANGFQPNRAAGVAGANMYNDLTSNCGLAMIGGVAGLGGAAATRSITGAISSITGMIAGCKPDSHAAAKNGPPFR